MADLKNADSPYTFAELEEAWDNVTYWKSKHEEAQRDIRVQEGRLATMREQEAEAEKSFAKAKADFVKRSQNVKL